jgi:hypothetical protein
MILIVVVILCVCSIHPPLLVLLLSWKELEKQPYNNGSRQFLFQFDLLHHHHTTHTHTPVYKSCCYYLVTLDVFIFVLTLWRSVCGGVGGMIIIIYITLSIEVISSWSRRTSMWNTNKKKEYTALSPLFRTLDDYYFFFSSGIIMIRR